MIITTENAYLFVYGSLMLNIGSPMSNFLAQRAKFIGEGKVKGYLYDIGSYPGLVVDKQNGSLITGHVFELRHAEQVWKVLDDYEDYRPDEVEKSLYRRERALVMIAGKALDCQTYLYNQSVAQLAIIPTGNYADWWQQAEKHQQFIQQGGNAIDYL
ncbi:MAG: gamma-glutamylcyclotransferase [Saprospiraceae bacterium]